MDSEYRVMVGKIKLIEDKTIIILFKFQIFKFLKHIKFSIYSIILMSCLP